MANFKVNNIVPDIGKIKVGVTNVSKIFQGITQVWPLGDFLPFGCNEVVSGEIQTSSTSNAIERNFTVPESFAGKKVRLVFEYKATSSSTGDLQITNINRTGWQRNDQNKLKILGGSAGYLRDIFDDGVPEYEASADNNYESNYDLVTFRNISTIFDNGGIPDGGGWLRRVSGNTNEANTGIDDMSSGINNYSSGHYLYSNSRYANSSPAGEQYRSWLRSPEYFVKADTITGQLITNAIKFHVGAYGAGIGDLCVRLKKVGDAEKPKVTYKSSVSLDNIVFNSDSIWGNGSDANYLESSKDGSNLQNSVCLDTGQMTNETGVKWIFFQVDNLDYPAESPFALPLSLTFSYHVESSQTGTGFNSKDMEVTVYNYFTDLAYPNHFYDSTSFSSNDIAGSSFQDLTQSSNYAISTGKKRILLEGCKDSLDSTDVTFTSGYLRTGFAFRIRKRPSSSGTDYSGRVQIKNLVVKPNFPELPEDLLLQYINYVSGATATPSGRGYLNDEYIFNQIMTGTDSFHNIKYINFEDGFFNDNPCEETYFKLQAKLETAESSTNTIPSGSRITIFSRQQDSESWVGRGTASVGADWTNINLSRDTSLLKITTGNLGSAYVGKISLRFVLVTQ